MLNSPPRSFNVPLSKLNFIENENENDWMAEKMVEIQSSSRYCVEFYGTVSNKYG